jgi:hypothetical protein
MTTPSQQKTCPYCVQPIQGKPEAEHVFPSSWYPDSTEKTQRLLAPSCSKCNRALGKIEERLLRNWGLSVSNTAVASRGVPDRVLRSLDPTRGRTAQDSLMRAKSRKSVKARARFFSPEAVGAFPGLQATDLTWGKGPSGLWVPGAPGLTIDSKDVEAFTAKLVRGLYYIGSHGTVLPKSVRIRTFVPGRASWPELQRFMLDNKMVTRGVPPGFLYWVGFAEGNPLLSFWIFSIWGRILLGASTDTDEQET